MADVFSIVGVYISAVASYYTYVGAGLIFAWLIAELTN